MKKIIFVLALVVGMLFPLAGQTSGPMDLVVLLDTSASMSNSYQGTSDYIIGPFLREFLRIGDTFHLISFSGEPKLEISRRVEGVGDVETIIGRFLLMYPLSKETKVADALDFGEKYASSLPGSRHKKIILITDGDDAGTDDAVSLVSSRMNISRAAGTGSADLQYIKVPVTGTPPVSGRPRAVAQASGTGASQSAPPPLSSGGGTQSGRPAVSASAGTPSQSDSPRPQSSQAGQSQTAPSRPGSAQTAPEPGAAGTASSQQQGAAQTAPPSSTASTPQSAQSRPSASSQAQETAGSQAPSPSSRQPSTSQSSGGTQQPEAQTAQPRPALVNQNQTPQAAGAPAASANPPSSGGVASSPAPGSESGVSRPETAQQIPEAASSGETPPARSPQTGTSETSAPAVETPPPRSSSAPPKTLAEVTPARQNDASAGGIALDDLPLPLIIALIILALLILGLIIFFASRRLRDSPNRAMAQAAAPADTTASEMMADYAAKNKNYGGPPLVYPPQKLKPLPNDKPVNQNLDFDNGAPLLSLFVADQNTAIGRRNIHAVKQGYTFTIGGGKSDFLIFLVPIPPHIADLTFDGRQCTFIPRKPQYFPDIGSQQVSNCIGKTIRVISDRNYELHIRIERYEDPLKALNNLLHSIQVPG